MCEEPRTQSSLYIAIDSSFLNQDDNFFVTDDSIGKWCAQRLCTENARLRLLKDLCFPVALLFRGVCWMDTAGYSCDGHAPWRLSPPALEEIHCVRWC